MPPDPATLARALRAGVGLGEEWPIEVTGPEAVLRSSFAVDTGAAAVVAATASAAAEISAERSDSRQRRVRVHTTACALAFQSERHLRQPTSTPLWDPLSGYYRTADGFVQFHTNFEHHRDGLLRALQMSRGADRAQVESACLSDSSAHLEEIVSATGGIAATLRSFEEWAAHPHGLHTARAPLVNITAWSTGRPQTLGAAPAARPLDGLRVLDLTRIIAGPVATRNLAAYGASVMRIGAEHLPVIEPILADTTLGKSFSHLDLRTSLGRDHLLQLIRQSDVMVTGFRPGALAGLGLGRDDIFAANTSLVLAEVNAFGSDGPWGGRRGFDSITQTATGIVDAETSASNASAPRPLPCQFLDHGTGYLMSLAVMAALLARHRTGGGQLVEVSLLGTRNWLVDLGRVDHLGVEPPSVEEIEKYLQERMTPMGSISHVSHPGMFEGADLRYTRGPTPPGADPAVWPTS